MKITDFMFFRLYHMYGSTNPALIAYRKPQGRALTTLSAGGLLWMMAAASCFVIYTLGSISYSSATLLAPFLLAFALWCFLYYRFHKRYVRGFPALAYECSRFPKKQTVWGILLTLVFCMLPVALLAMAGYALSGRVCDQSGKAHRCS